MSDMRAPATASRINVSGLESAANEDDEVTQNWPNVVVDTRMSA